LRRNEVRKNLAEGCTKGFAQAPCKFWLEYYACSGNVTLREKNAILQNVVKQELEKLAVFSAF
jgi:hypothetical protein